MSVSKTHRKSSWTPLSNEKANEKLFDERLDLILKWFDLWSEHQKKIFLAEVIAKCSYPQVEYIHRTVKNKVSEKRVDLTRVLPRALSLYIFSFLDPRSLSRAARVSHYWCHLTSSDDVWMPKCLRLGWLLQFSPSPFEDGVWKRNYIENMRQLQFAQLPPGSARSRLSPLDASQNFNELMQLELETQRSTAREQPSHRPPSSHSRPSSAVSNRVKYPSKLPVEPMPRRRLDHGDGDGRPPWRGNDPTPTDIIRYNYLRNDQLEFDKKKKNHARAVRRRSDNKLPRSSSATALSAEGPLADDRLQNYPEVNTTATPSNRPLWAQPQDAAAVPTPRRTIGNQRPPVAPARATADVSLDSRAWQLPDDESARDQW